MKILYPCGVCKKAHIGINSVSIRSPDCDHKGGNEGRYQKALKAVQKANARCLRYGVCLPGGKNRGKPSLRW